MFESNNIYENSLFEKAELKKRLWKQSGGWVPASLRVVEGNWEEWVKLAVEDITAAALSHPSVRLKAALLLKPRLF